MTEVIVRVFVCVRSILMQRSSLTCCLYSLQAKEMMEEHVRYDERLLWTAARTGIVEVWKIVVEAIMAAGQNAFEKVSKIEANAGEITSAVLLQISSLRRSVTICCTEC